MVWEGGPSSLLFLLSTEAGKGLRWGFYQYFHTSQTYWIFLLGPSHCIGLFDEKHVYMFSIPSWVPGL